MASSTRPPDFRPPIPAEKLKRYERRFQALAQGKTYLSTSEASMIFLDYGLNRENVSSMWARVDANADGRLGKDEFCHAMHLIDSGQGNAPAPHSVDPPPGYAPPAGGFKSMLDVGEPSDNPPIVQTSLSAGPDGAPPSYQSTTQASSQASSSRLQLPGPVILDKPKVLACRKCTRGLAPGDRLYYCGTCGDRAAYCIRCMPPGGCPHKLPTVRWELGANWPVREANMFKGDCRVCGTHVHTGEPVWHCSRCLGLDTCEDCWRRSCFCGHEKNGYVSLKILERNKWF